MSRARFLFIFGFLITMAAGFVLGIAVGRASGTAAVAGTKPEDTRNHPPSLEVELNMTPEQAAKSREIWAPLWQADRGRNDRNQQALRQKRDEAIQALIPAERKGDYDRIRAEYDASVAEGRKEHDRLFQETEQKMKAILSAEQWKKFEELKKKRSEQGRGMRPATTQGGGHRPPAPATQGQGPGGSRDHP